MSRDHVYELNHVAEDGHGYLTMSPIINGTCEDSGSTLGPGDVEGLEALY